MSNMRKQNMGQNKAGYIASELSALLSQMQKGDPDRNRGYEIEYHQRARREGAEPQMPVI